MYLIANIIAVALAAAASPAGQTVAVPAFQALELHGGGEVIVRQGPRQQVRLLSGSTEVSRFRVERSGRDSKLTVSACENRCPARYKLQIEIITPSLSGLAVNGGGVIALRGPFPEQGALGLTVSGGGIIDARRIRASTVGASVNGGGSISTHALRTLAANINGGGSIRYWGEPGKVVNVNGGGAVTPGR
jgi:hypothetical protein